MFAGDERDRSVQDMKELNLLRKTGDWLVLIEVGVFGESELVSLRLRMTLKLLPP